MQFNDCFVKIEQNMAGLFLKNEKLCKLLWHNDNNPLAQHMDEDIAQNMLIDFVEEVDGEGNIQLIENPDCRVFFVPFTDLVETPLKSQLRVYTARINPDNIYISEVFVQIDIIVPQQLNKLRNGRRRESILSEVMKTYNGQEIGLLNPLAIVKRPIDIRHFRGTFFGYSVLFSTRVA